MRGWKMDQYVLLYDGREASLMMASSREEAIRIAVAVRISSGKSPEEAVRLCLLRDKVLKVACHVRDQPYQGEMEVE
jgi:hypothetical protein